METPIDDDPLLWCGEGSLGHLLVMITCYGVEKAH